MVPELDAPGGGYGIAVTGTMVITTILAFRVMRHLWHWSLPRALLVAGSFLVIDVAFLASNLVKVGTAAGSRSLSRP